MSKLRYKIETRFDLWQLNISYGEYSDRVENFFLVYASSAEEAWLFYKEYRKATSQSQRCDVLALQDDTVVDEYAEVERCWVGQDKPEQQLSDFDISWQVDRVIIKQAEIMIVSNIQIH